ncbi:hypothetical protein ACPPVW_11995 [Leifsonia sp. McL0607]|uniref:hypothetical protein n=1 Tax=Leifsonia sp. McL0607 TaxID=3415672 RepID=UPI003CEF9117
MDPLLYRRQFLLTPRDVQSLAAWPRRRVRSHWIYTHPDLAVTVHDEPDSAAYALLGFAIDPADPDATDDVVLSRLAATQSDEDRLRILNRLTGRFALFVFDDDEILAFNDATGMRTVEYTWTGDEFHAASQALLLEHAAPIERGKRLRGYEEIARRAGDREAFLPAALSGFENVDRLVPNHVLRVSARRQERFWPTTQLPTDGDPDSVAAAISEIASKTLLAASKRFPLALTLTGGWDSRSVLSAMGPVLDDVYIYTLRYRHLSRWSPDLAIPRHISKRLGKSQHVIDCRQRPSAAWLDVYAGNSAMAHLDDWGVIAAGIYQGFPADRVAVKGNAAELARSIYWYEDKGKQRAFRTPDEVIALIDGWSGFDFIVESIEEWFAGARSAADETGVALDVLFHWEHRCGAWQAQSQLEWDIAQEVISPFNNRDLLALAQSVPPEHRAAPEFALSRKIIAHGGLDLLREPVNPHTPGYRLLDLFQRGKHKLRRELRKRMKG